MSDPQQQIINIAMKELNKIINDYKDGKVPQMTSSMQILASQLSNINDTNKSMSEEEVKEFAQKLLDQMSALENII